VADRVAVHRVRSAFGVHPLVDLLLELRGQAEAAVPFGEVHPRETAVELLAEEHLGIGGGGREGGEEVVDEFGDAALIGAQLGGRGIDHGHARNVVGDVAAPPTVHAAEPVAKCLTPRDRFS
jgi:hypothetical protein